MTYTERIDTFIASLDLDAYRVGGSVRDEILGRKVKDCDYVVFGVTLDEIKDVLDGAGDGVKDYYVRPLTLRDGRQAGWRVSGKGLGLIEILLPRTERSTGPGHRDFEIVLDPQLTIKEDAIRRDFTFNAIYLGPVREGFEATVHDPVRGVNDLLRRQINVTHADSFRDDALRTLRALRFVSVLGYDLGPETRVLMALHAEHVTGLTLRGTSGTVLDELCAMLMGQDPAKSLRLARDTGVLAVAYPELAPMLGFDQGSRYHDMTTDEHTFKALETAARVDAPLRVRLALLFHDSGKPEAAWVGKDGRKHYYSNPSEGKEDHEVVGQRIWLEAAERLGVERRMKLDVAALILNHMVPCQKVNPTRVRRERVRLGDDMLRDLHLMRMCDLTGKGEANKTHLANVAAMETIRKEAEQAKVPASKRDLEIDGHDVARLGVPGGRAVGDLLDAVLDEVVCQPHGVRLTRDWQIERAEALR